MIDSPLARFAARARRCHARIRGARFARRAEPRAASQVARLKAICGPEDVDDARRLAPTSIRARYGAHGGGRARNAVFCSHSEAEASDELRVLFPSPALDQLDASAYLAATVLPSVNEAMASLCASRPADAHGALSAWIRANSPALASSLVTVDEVAGAGGASGGGWRRQRCR